jgi:hypothetical protein
MMSYLNIISVVLQRFHYNFDVKGVAKILYYFDLK